MEYFKVVNWEMSIEVAKRIKEEHPGCLIILGGPQIPRAIQGFFDEYPFVDLVVHGEGEITFSEILIENINNKRFGSLKGLSINNGNKMIGYESRNPISDLETIPSPYLTGVFEKLMQLPYNFQPIWETNRGCPYSCAYCDWGDSSLNKLRIFNNERLSKEIDWFGKHKINFLFGSDANFGILPRDLNIARELASKKIETGYPGKFRVSYAKESNERVFDIAKIFNDQNMDKGISLSVQSMDEKALTAIKRKNLRIESFSNFISKYQEANIPTFTELILGLPGETYESFKKGIDKLLTAGAHDSLVIYNCTVLPNSQLNIPEYVDKYGIKTTRSPIFLNHSLPADDPVKEYEYIITGTKDMPTERWKDQYIFAWAIQAFHALNLTQIIAVYMNYLHNIKYSDFYESLIEFGKKYPDMIIGQELKFVKDKIEEVLQGKGWDIVLDKFGNITWSTEEATYLKISDSHKRFYQELHKFMDFLCTKQDISIQKDIIKDIIQYQESIIVKWIKSGDSNIRLKYPIHTAYHAILKGKKPELIKREYILIIKDDLNLNGNSEKYAREIVWWGRKGGRFIYQNVQEMKV